MSLNTTTKSYNNKWESIINSYSPIIGEILLYNIKNGGYDKHKQNRSQENWDKLIYTLLTINDQTLKSDRNQKTITILTKLFNQTGNKENNIIHSHYVSPEQILSNKFNERLMMNYIQHILEQENNSNFIITQSSIKNDLGKGYDYIIQCNNQKYYVDIKIRRKIKNPIYKKDNIHYIYLSTIEFNQIKESSKIILNYINLKEINDLNQINKIVSEYFTYQSIITPQNIEQYNMNLRNKKGTKKSPQYNSRKDRFKDGITQPPYPVQITDLHAND